MPKQPDLEHLNHTELISLVRELLARVEKLETENTRLRENNAQLRAENQGLKRERARQAAPFSRNQPKSHPQRPGRKPGLGQFKHRQPPEPAEITQVVPVRLEASPCPKCGSPLEASGMRRAWITELPKLKPEVLEYQLERQTCPACGLRVQATHPMVSRDQVGASAHRLGPRALALAHALQYEHGITARKVPVVLKRTTGIQVTQSALTQAALKHASVGGLIGEQYQVLRSKLQAARVVNTDDTGWRVAGTNAFLMAFKTASSLVYQIRTQHRSTEVLEVIPASFAGVMACDRFSSYDARVFDQVRQQKCIAHILKNLKVLLETCQGRARDVPLKLRAVFKTALRLHSRFTRGEVLRACFDRQGRAISRQLSKLLRPRRVPLTRANERLRRELAWHHARGSLLRFLVDPWVSPTNNAAERALRPAVIFRKLCAGSKSWGGARALEAFKSVIESAKLSGSSGFDVLTEVYSQR